MSRKRKSPHVPDQYAGYSLQTTRMTELLLKALFGSNVSIEVFEDVGATFMTISLGSAEVAETLLSMPFESLRMRKI